MNKQFLVRVEDKNNIEFLEKFGSIVHVAKLRSVVVFETTELNAEKLSKHPLIIDLKPSNKYQLA